MNSSVHDNSTGESSTSKDLPMLEIGGSDVIIKPKVMVGLKPGGFTANREDIISKLRILSAMSKIRDQRTKTYLPLT